MRCQSHLHLKHSTTHSDQAVRLVQTGLQLVLEGFMRCLRHIKPVMSLPVSIGMSSSLQSCSLPDCSERSPSCPESIELAAAASAQQDQGVRQAAHGCDYRTAPSLAESCRLALMWIRPCASRRGVIRPLRQRCTPTSAYVESV